MPEAVARSSGADGATAGRLAHHWSSFREQKEASTLGMWVFLVTEIMFFGGLFTVYLVYRTRSALEFAIASHELDIRLGALNTGILITSSLTMALAVQASQRSQRKRMVALMLATLVLGGAFLGVKAVEYHEKFTHHHVPGPSFHFAAPPEISVPPAVAARLESRAEQFFAIYFSMTGLHAIHMIIGMLVLLAMLRPAIRGRYDADYHNPVECFGLYWHFVDVIWIFLFPLLYLLGRHLG